MKKIVFILAMMWSVTANALNFEGDWIVSYEWKGVRMTDRIVMNENLTSTKSKGTYYRDGNRKGIDMFCEQQYRGISYRCSSKQDGIYYVFKIFGFNGVIFDNEYYQSTQLDVIEIAFSFLGTAKAVYGYKHIDGIDEVKSTYNDSGFLYIQGVRYLDNNYEVILKFQGPKTFIIYSVENTSLLSNNVFDGQKLILPNVIYNGISYYVALDLEFGEDFTIKELHVN